MVGSFRPQTAPLVHASVLAAIWSNNNKGRKQREEEMTFGLFMESF